MLCGYLLVHAAPDNMKQPKVCPISQVPGVAHTCGHDAHAAMLLTAGKILKDHESEIPGRVILCFERGEEGGHGVEFILRYLERERIRIDGCHALHVASNIPAGKLAARYGPTTAGNFAYDITLTGKGGHGSRPDLSNSPLDCFHAIYADLQSIWMQDVNPSEPPRCPSARCSTGPPGTSSPPRCISPATAASSARRPPA